MTLVLAIIVRRLVPHTNQDWLVLPQPHAELGLGQCYVIETIITCQLVLAYVSTRWLIDEESRILSCVAVGTAAAVGTLFAVSLSVVNHD